MSKFSEEVCRNAVELTQWEVRSPLRHGSKHEAFFSTEDEARKFAGKLGRKRGCHHLMIHTRSRVVYIDRNDD